MPAALPINNQPANPSPLPPRPRSAELTSKPAPQPAPIPLTIDRRGFVYADGVKICYLDRRRQTLQFHDKNKHRARQRGTSQITVALADLARLINPPQP